MSAVLPDPTLRLTHEAYFQLEQDEDHRYEYLAGEVFAMAGGSESHALISANTLTSLAITLRDKPCRVYGSDMKLRIESVDKFCYPDITVLCQQEHRTPRFIEDPILIVEVLSDSTESYDRGLKFEHYRTLPGLKYYLLITQDRPHVELYQRNSDNSWLLREFSGMEAKLHLEELEIELELGEIYRNVEFVPEADHHLTAESPA